MANQGNWPVDPYEDFYVHVGSTNVAQTPLPPETMTRILEEALICESQRCIFTHFVPGMRLCDADTVSSAPDTSNTLFNDIIRDWIWDTWIKADEPDKRGEYHRNHRHQCIRANIPDDLYLRYTGGDPDAPVRRMDAPTWAAELQDRGERMAVRTTLAAYQRWAIPHVVRRVAMVYGQEYECEYRDRLMGDPFDEANQASIAAGRPIAIDLAALSHLPFVPEAVPLQHQGSADPRRPRRISDDISILIVNTPRIRPQCYSTTYNSPVNGNLGPNRETMYDRVQRDFRAAPRLDWSRFSTGRLRAVFLDFQRRNVHVAGTGARLERLAEDMARAGLRLDVLCLAHARGISGFIPKAEDREKREAGQDAEVDGRLVDGEGFVRYNPIPIFKRVIRPGGRIVFADTGSFGEVRPCGFEAVSLVM